MKPSPASAIARMATSARSRLGRTRALADAVSGHFQDTRLTARLTSASLAGACRGAASTGCSRLASSGETALVLRRPAFSAPRVLPAVPELLMSGSRIKTACQGRLKLGQSLEQCSHKHGHCNRHDDHGRAALLRETKASQNATEATLGTSRPPVSINDLSRR
jgi:hypothetical protein